MLTRGFPDKTFPQQDFSPTYITMQMVLNQQYLRFPTNTLQLTQVQADSGMIRSLAVWLNLCCLGMIKVIVSVDHSASNRKCHTHAQTHTHTYAWTQRQRCSSKGILRDQQHDDRSLPLFQMATLVVKLSGKTVQADNSTSHCLLASPCRISALNTSRKVLSEKMSFRRPVGGTSSNRQ